MRKGIVIAGAVILVIGIAVAAGGFYLVLGESGLGSSLINTQKTTLVLAPGGSFNIGTTQTGQITIVDYSDNAGAPIQVSSSGTTPIERTTTGNGATYYISIFTSLGTGAAPVVLHNNLTSTVSVQYVTAQSSLGALAYGGLLVLGGGVLFLVGIVVLIAGVVMKKRMPPNQGSVTPQPVSAAQV